MASASKSAPGTTRGVPAIFNEEYFAWAFRGRYALTASLRKHRHYLLALRRAGAGSPLLEVGCAYGYFLRRTCDHFEAFACDPCPALAVAAAAAAPEAHVFAAALPDLAVRAESLGTVVCADVLEHVADVSSSLLALRQALRPGGTLLLIVPVYDGPLGPIIRYLDRDPTHCHRCSRAWWLRQVRAAGFSVVRADGVLRYPLAGRFYLYLSGPPLRWIGTALALALRKPA